MTSKCRSFVLLIFIINAIRNVLVLELLFSTGKSYAKCFCIFEELVFFDLWILEPDSGFRFRNPVSGF